MIIQVLPPFLRKYFPLFLALLVMGIYCNFVYFVFIRTSLKSLPECIYVCIGTFSILMVFWSLYRTSTADPGFIPRNTLNEGEQTDQAKCLTCRIKRPERSHHCSKCRRCVLNMDHHCMWTNNCIGLYNRKYFILILFWGSFGMLQATLLGLTNAQLLWNNIQKYESWQFEKVKEGFIFLMTCSQFLNAFGLYYFFWNNFKLVIANLSTLDELTIEAQRINNQYNVYNNIMQPQNLTVYNLGFCYNFQFYFGKNPLIWLLPIGKPLGDGYYWDKKTTIHELVETTIE